MRRFHPVCLILASSFFLCAHAGAQGIITTVAGGGPNNMPALSASLSQPSGVATDAAGNMYVVTGFANFVFKVDAVGRLTILAGNGTLGFGGDGGPASNAVLSAPNQVAVDSAGNVFIADTWNHRIRRVEAATGIITTVAGNGNWAFSGDGGPATGASLALPSGIALDAAGNLFIADRSNNRIRRVEAASGVISTVAGGSLPGSSGDGGPATNAALNGPLGVAVDAAGNLFIADTSNNRIRRIDAATGIITTVAGNGLAGFSGDGGPATNASLNYPYDVAVGASGSLLISDMSNHRVRRVDLATGVISTVAGDGTTQFKGDGGLATNASLFWPAAVKMDSAGNVFLADSVHHRIRRIDAATGIITTLAGNGTFGFSGDNHIATDASLPYPFSLAQDRAGNLFVADSGNLAVRKLDAVTGMITTVAGNGNPGFALDGDPATSSIGQPLAGR
ncbi:MAG: SMP-30/gluconolactonase/LRE family protein [Acidobacteria bacterium]|nr:SMP-30/gluconolactonase/LRE family protein [Acidobacteriota bacterium]